MKKRWFWVIAVLVAAMGVGYWANLPQSPAVVRTTVLTPTQVEQTVSCNGVLEAADGVGVFAPIGCRIREVHVTVGQRVQKGDVLAVIDKEGTLSDSGDVATQVALAALESELVAPEDGIVVEVSAEAGETLKLGTPCVLLVRPCDMRVRVAIREKDLRVLREGMRVRISGDGLEKSFYDGVLSDISCTASTGTSSTVVAGVVTPDDGVTDASFRLGLTAKATVITAVTEAGYVIPYEAVLADEEGSYCYVLREGVARIYRIANAAQAANGWLLTDESLNGATIIMEPEKVEGDGATVTEAIG